MDINSNEVILSDDHDWNATFEVTLADMNVCSNLTFTRTCYYSLVLIQMTQKTTLWLNLILILVGLIVNSLVILVFSRTELRKLSISIHTIALALSDMFLLCMPVFLKWLSEIKPQLSLFKTSFWCKTHGYFDIAFCCWSAWNVVALSNERWIAICRPSTISIKSPKKRAYIISLIIPFAALLAFIWYPIIIQVNHLKTSDNTNLFKLNEESFCHPIDNRLLLMFGLMSIFITYVVPFVLITFYNSRIVKTLNERIAKRKEYFMNGFNKQPLKGTEPAEQGSKKSGKRASVVRKEMEEAKKYSAESAETQQSPVNIRKASKKSFRRFSADLTRRQSKISTSIDGKFKRSSGTNTEILKARERINQYQRVNNDCSINIMLITVSVSFLILTFPYQLVWLCDQIYRDYIMKKASEPTTSENMRLKETLEMNLFIYLMVSFSIKDISLMLRNLNFSINFFLYSTMSNLFRKELNCLFQNMGFYNFKLFKNSLSTTTNTNYVQLTQRTNRSRLPSNISNLASVEKSQLSTTKV